MPLNKITPKGAPYRTARELAKEGRLKEAISCLEATPQGSRDLTLHPAIVDSLRAMNPKTLILKVTLNQFQNLPAVDPTKTLILHGESGVGKSSLAKALLPKALMINHVDQLRGYDPLIHEGVIFDDMNFSHWPRESHIHVVDVEEDRAIHCRYAYAFLPAGTRRIMTTNLAPHQMLMTADTAVARRCQAFYMLAHNKFEETRL